VINGTKALLTFTSRDSPDINSHASAEHEISFVVKCHGQLGVKALIGSAYLSVGDNE